MNHTVIYGPLQSDREAWAAARRGKATSSRFDDVMTPPKTIGEALVNRYAYMCDEPRFKVLKSGPNAGTEKEVPGYSGMVMEAAEAKGVIFWGDTALSYMRELVAATITGKDKLGAKSAAIDRGNDKEVDAGDTYSRHRFVYLKPAQFVSIEGTIIGCTPDFRCEADQMDQDGPGLIQVKCPDAGNYLKHWWIYREAEQALGKPPVGLEHVQEDYRWQIVGELWVTGYRWNDFMQFDDRFPERMSSHVVRVHAEAVQAKMERLAERVHAFADMVQQKVDDIRLFLDDASPSEVAAVHEALLEPEPTNTVNPFEDL